MTRRVFGFNKANAIDTHDERVLFLFMKITAPFTLLVSLVYWFIHSLDFIAISLLSFGALFLILNWVKGWMEYGLLKFVYTSSLYFLFIVLWLFTYTDVNNYYLYLLLLFATIILYRKYYLLSTIFNIGIVFILSNVYQPTGEYFSTLQVEQVFFSMRFNYVVMALAAVVIAYVTTESIHMEKAKTDEANRKLEKNYTKLTESNNRLKQLSESQSKLLSLISHDVKNPIDSLTGMVNLMRKDLLSEAEIKHISNNLHAQLLRTSTSLENILNWSKTQLNGLTTDVTEFNVCDEIRPIAELSHDIYSSKSIVVDVDCTVQGPIKGDINAFRIAVRNILSNAYKFTPNGGNIKIEAVEQEDTIMVSIADTGKGMSDEQVKNIFRSPASTLGTNGEKGNGLGMMMVKEFLDAANAKISIDSEKGKGTIFSIELTKMAIENTEK